MKMNSKCVTSIVAAVSIDKSRSMSSRYPIKRTINVSDDDDDLFVETTKFDFKPNFDLYGNMRGTCGCPSDSSLPDWSPHLPDSSHPDS